MQVHSPEPFPDLELGLIEWAQAKYPTAHVGDELPTNYESRLPVIEIVVDGGATDGLTWLATVDIAVWAQDGEGLSGRERARRIAFELCSSIGVYPRHFGGVVADTVEVAEWPSRSKRDEPDERTTCFSGEVVISLRRK